MAKPAARVVLAEDNDIVRMGIKSVLAQAPDIAVVGEAKNGAEALALVDELEPDVLLLDIEMPLQNGIHVARQLKKMGSTVQVLVLSAYDDPAYIREILAIGASGYLVKGEDPDQIAAAVRIAAEGARLGVIRPIPPKHKRNKKY